jgi:hypothetical protein
MDQRQNLKIIMLRLVVSGYINCPSENSSTIITSGGNVAANNTNGNASYLKSNGSSLDTKPATANYTYNHTNFYNQNYELEVTSWYDCS